MSESKRSLSLLLGFLEEDGHLDAAKSRRARASLEARPDAGTHWAIQALLAAGAWLASLLGVLFVLVTVGFNVRGSGLIPLGVVMMVGGIALTGSGSMFLAQLARALMLTGKLLAVSGGWEMQRGGDLGLAVAVAVWGALHVFPVDRVTRFLSTGVTICVATACLCDKSPQWIGTLIAATGAAACWWFSTRGAPRRLAPAAYACALALPALLGMRSAMHHRMDLYPDILERVVLMVVLLRSIAAARRDLPAPSENALLFTTAGVCALAVLGSPGLLAAGALLVLGQDRQDRLLATVGGLALVYFLAWFYRDMRITLAAKSLALIASGLVLLAGRLYLLARPWAYGGAR